MRDRVGDLLPALDGPCVHSATCMYSNTPDEHFVIARHPDCANVTVACGFSGHGFKFVPVVGEILADLAMTGRRSTPSTSSIPGRLVTDVTDNPALLATLAGDFYTSPEVFAAEQDQIFENMWFCAARSAELAAPGQFKTVQVGRESVLVVRGKDGHAAGVPQRLPAPRGDAVHRVRRARSSGTCSARTTPGPTRWTASSSPRPTWRR